MEKINAAVDIFCFRDSDVRVTKIDGEPWFVAKDVCDALGLTNSRVAVNSLDDDEKGVSNVYTPGGIQTMTIISLPGLFRLVSKSRVPLAREFQRWVFHDVLPSIYYTGSYRVPQAVYEPIGVDFQTARLLIDSARIFRDVMPKPMRKQVMARVFELAGAAPEFADDDEAGCVSDAVMAQVVDFIAARCVVDPLARCPREVFYGCFVSWCRENDLPVPSQTRTTRAMNRLGRFRCGRSALTRYWEGVRCA